MVATSGTSYCYLPLQDRSRARVVSGSSTRALSGKGNGLPKADPGQSCDAVPAAIFLVTAKAEMCSTQLSMRAGYLRAQESVVDSHRCHPTGPAVLVRPSKQTVMDRSNYLALGIVGAKVHYKVQSEATPGTAKYNNDTDHVKVVRDCKSTRNS